MRARDGRLVLAAADADRSPQLVQAFQAQAIPTVVAVVAGQPVPLFAGVQPDDVIEQVFDQLLELGAQHGVTGRVEADGEQARRRGPGRARRGAAAAAAPGGVRRDRARRLRGRGIRLPHRDRAGPARLPRRRRARAGEPARAPAGQDARRDPERRGRRARRPGRAARRRRPRPLGRARRRRVRPPAHAVPEARRRRQARGARAPGRALRGRRHRRPARGRGPTPPHQPALLTRARTRPRAAAAGGSAARTAPRTRRALSARA